MDPTQLSVILQSFAALGLLLFVYRPMYQRTHQDRLREDLFTIRDELFDYMHQNDVPYDYTAYHDLRDFLNGIIRFIDQFRLSTLVAFAYFTRHSRAASPPFTAAISRIPDPAVRAHLTGVYHRVFRRLFVYFLQEGMFSPMIEPLHWLFRRLPYTCPDFLHFPTPEPRAFAQRPSVTAVANGFTLLGRPNSLAAQLLRQPMRLRMSDPAHRAPAQ